MAADSPIRCIILGGGGHSKVLIDAFQSRPHGEIVAVLDRDPSLWGTDVLSIPVRGGDELLDQMAGDGITHFFVGLGGVGDNAPRRRLFELAVAQGLQPLTIVHISAVCSSWASVGAGSAILPAAVVNAGATLGQNVIVNTGAIVEHDCQIGDHAHIATGSRLCSAVAIGVGAHIGAGATVRQSISIGEGAIVGAGAVVVKDVPSWNVVAGVPAQPMETIRKANIGAAHRAANTPK